MAHSSIVQAVPSFDYKMALSDFRISKQAIRTESRYLFIHTFAAINQTFFDSGVSQFVFNHCCTQVKGHDTSRRCH